MDKKWTKFGQKLIENRQKRTKDGPRTKIGQKFNRKGEKVDRKWTKCEQKIDNK